MGKLMFQTFIHVGGSHPMTNTNKDVIEYDRATDVDKIAHARKNDLPLYEVKSKHGETLELTTDYDHAKKVVRGGLKHRDKEGGWYGRHILMIKGGKKWRVEA